MKIDYESPPTCGRFMSSAAFGRLIAGPVGSGKTTACMFELLRRACEQAKAPDGFRYTRFAIVRQTLEQLKHTVLKDITSWLKGIAEYKVSDKTIFIRVGDVRSEWVLIPLDDPEDQARLLSSQLTGVWMSECIEMDVSLIGPLSGRCGRYPGPALGGWTWKGIIADTNFPIEGSDWYKLMENPGPDWQVFKQPGGLDPDAENLNWLNQTTETLKLPYGHEDRVAQGRKFYQDIVANIAVNGPDYINRYVHAKYGNDPSGTAVYRETFIRSFHTTSKLEPSYGHPFIIGQDFGRDPCSIICQMDHRGRFLVLEEVLAEDMGLELHMQRNLRPALAQERYIGVPIAIVGDPAGRQKNSHYEETSFDLMKRMGFHAFPAPTNDIDTRIRAIEQFLLAQRGGSAAILIDSTRCPKLVQALAGGYRYAKAKNGVRKPTPDKTGAGAEFTHIVDALQYACLAAAGGMTNMIAARLAPRRSSPPAFSARAWT